MILDMTTFEEIHRRLRIKALEQGTSMNSFCRDKLKCSPQFLFMVFAGTRKAPQPFVRALAGILGWPVLQVALMFGYTPKSLRDLAIENPKKAYDFMSLALSKEKMAEEPLVR